jgi:hypothetical protein
MSIGISWLSVRTSKLSNKTFRLQKTSGISSARKRLLVSQERLFSMEFTNEVVRQSTIQPTIQDHTKRDEMITKIKNMSAISIKKKNI